MPAKYSLRSRFEADGVFWPAGTSKKQFSAHLSARGGVIELAAAAESAGPERLFSGPDNETTPDVVHGYSTIGPCSLIGLQESGGVRNFDAGTGQVIIARQFRVNLCVVGLHVADEREPVFVSASFGFAGTGDWLRTATRIQITNGATIITHPIPIPTIVDFCMVPSRTRIQLRVVPNVTFSPSGRHSASREEPQITIETQQPVSLEWMYGVAVRFENFLSLCLGSSVRLRAVEMTSSDRKDGCVVRPVRRKAESPDLQAFVRCNSSQLAVAMSRWFATPEKFQSLENLIYGSIRNSSMFVETEFLSLAQAVESFHRLIDPITLEEPSAFKRVLKPILGAISAACGKSALADRLSDSIRYANEPSFRDRVESLISGLSPVHIRTLLGDPEKFEQTLRQTRNFFTHPGIKKGSHVLTGAKDIFLFNQKLHAFLRLLLLISVCFSEGDVFDLVRYQSRK